MSAPRLLIIPLLVAAALAAAPASAGAALAVTGARISDTAGAVRVTVALSGTPRLLAGEVMLRDQNLERRGRTVIAFERAGIVNQASSATGHGVTVRFSTASRSLRMSLTSRARTFKYLRYRVARGPDRLVVDLYKRRAAGQIASDGCLRIATIEPDGRRIRMTGRALQPLFERALAIAVRDPSGRLLGVVGLMTSAGNRWSGTVRIPALRPNTRYYAEALVQSAKDGSLECFAQLPFGIFSED